MLEGLFGIRISKTADPLDIDNLPADVRKALLQGAGAFDPKSHDLFRFFVMPELLRPGTSDRDNLNRREKKNSFSRVDTILIHTEPSSARIRFLGIFPTTTMTTGQTLFDFDGEAVVETKLPTGKLSLTGHIKNLVRRREPKHRVIATRTDELAQWVFLKPYLDASDEFCLQFLCSVPRNLHDENRSVVCYVHAQQKGRDITQAKRRVRLPA